MMHGLIWFATAFILVLSAMWTAVVVMLNWDKIMAWEMPHMFLFATLVGMCAMTFACGASTIMSVRCFMERKRE